jgi:WD40 repeat protein
MWQPANENGRILQDSIMINRIFFSFLLLTLSHLFTATVMAKTPSPEPILRLETGMHTAAIRRMDVDKEGRYLVTASDDRTARVLDIATGKQLNPTL